MWMAIDGGLQALHVTGIHRPIEQFRSHLPAALGSSVIEAYQLRPFHFLELTRMTLSVLAYPDDRNRHSRLIHLFIGSSSHRTIRFVGDSLNHSTNDSMARWLDGPMTQWLD